MKYTEEKGTEQKRPIRHTQIIYHMYNRNPKRGEYGEEAIFEQYG